MVRRSHPPTLITLARRQIREAALLQREQLVLCACSGGPDSSALLHVLAGLRERLGHLVAACGVDHGLRANAAEELTLAQQLAEQLEVPFTRLSCRVTPGANLQARARKARHQLSL